MISSSVLITSTEGYNFWKLPPPTAMEDGDYPTLPSTYSMERPSILYKKSKSHWCTPYVPFERKTVFCMTKAQAHEVPKRGSKVNCKDVKPELWNKFYVLFTFVYQETPGNYGMEVTKGFAKGFLYEKLKGQADVHQNEDANLLVEKLKDQLKDAEDALLKAKVEEKAPFDAMDSALKERDFTQEVEECAQARMDFVKTMQVKRSTILLSAPLPKDPPVGMGILPLDKVCSACGLTMYDDDALEAENFTEVEFVGGNKCEEQNSKVLVHDEKEDVLDKEAELDAEVEIVGGYNYEEQDPKDNEVSDRDTSPSILQTIQMMQRERKRKMTDGDTKNPREDAEGQTKPSKDQLEKEIGEKSNMESGRKDAATSNIDNLDHLISMIAKSTMKDPLDVDTSFRLRTRRLSFEPPEENDEASMDVGGDASCAGGAVGAGDDTNIITDKYEPPREDGDTSMDAVVAVGVGEDTNIIIEKPESPQVDGDASVDVGGEASCANGVVGASDNTEMIIENSKPPQGDGDASVDVGGDGSCAAGAIGAEYARHDDGTMSQQREDGGGVADYVRNDDEMVSRPWENPRNIFFESKPALILGINGVLLTSIDKRYHSQMPAYWNDLEIVDRAGVFTGYKRDALAFLDWCLVSFDVFVWTCCMKNKAEKMLRACFSDQFC
ncbi:hypothetical protein L7F22_049731 [Adiantum nelumboides]|nr:hypothetical protein [Adiantum nelumboides]